MWGGFTRSVMSLLVVFPCVLVVSTLSSGYVRAPLPYRLVNAGLFDYKKKKKKKKRSDKHGGKAGVMRRLGESDTYISAFNCIQFQGRRFVDQESD